MAKAKHFRDFTIWAYFRLFLVTPFILLLTILHFTQLFFYYLTQFSSYIANKIDDLWNILVKSDIVSNFVHWNYK